MQQEDSEPMKWNCGINEEKLASDHIFEPFSELINVAPLTIKQATPDWFLLWGFSCTSLLTHHFLFELKKAVTTNATLFDSDDLSDLSNVLNAAHGMGWSRRCVSAS